jgi:hypothetical protein
VAVVEPELEVAQDQVQAQEQAVEQVQEMDQVQVRLEIQVEAVGLQAVIVSRLPLIPHPVDTHF